MVEEESSGIFSCDVCNICFATKSERCAHILSHFERQQCETKIIFKLCDLTFELHSGIGAQCGLMSIASDGHIDGDVATTSNQKRPESTHIIYLKKEAIQPVEEGSGINVADETVARRKSNRVRKKICYNSAVEDVPKAQCTDESESAVTEDDSYGSTTDIIIGGIEKRLSVSKPKKPRNTKNITCSECPALFNAPRTLQIHMRTVHGISPSTECDVCKKVFTSPGNLKQHKQTHNDTRRYMCSYCGIGFNLHFNLKDHMNVHTGSKPYVCGECGKTFTKAAYRMVHMRVHTGEKPYRCTFENCDRAYAHNTDLKRHRRAQHGIITKTFVCPICGKIFYENKCRARHLEKHGERN